MQADTLLLHRRSFKALTAPAPSRTQLDLLYRAALRAPDHKGLSPYRFVEMQGEGRKRLGTLMAQSVKAKQPSIATEKLVGVQKKAFNAPMVIAVIARIEDTSKIPRVEQVVTAGCAAHAMLYAAHAQGLGAFWWTGPYANDPVVRSGFNLTPMDELLGFINLGQPDGEVDAPSARDPEAFIERWTDA